jgi:hypothetical protein
MNAIVPASSQQASTSLGLVPRNMQEAMQLAEMMARGKMMPEHLRNSGDALMVVEQAMRWSMSPFAVAQSTFNIKGKLLFAGTIVAAAIENSGAIQGLIDYQFSGEGPNRKVTVIATRRGEAEPRTVEVVLKDAQTTNEIWKKQPDQQLCYHGARVWARRWTPGVMLGVYTPEEWRDQPQDNFSGTTINAEPLSSGQIIGDEIPARVMEPPRLTRGQFMDQLEHEIASALAGDDPKNTIDAILARGDVHKAEDTFTNGSRARLAKIIQDAMAASRVEAPGVDDDVFPGDKP